MTSPTTPLRVRKIVMRVKKVGDYKAVALNMDWADTHFNGGACCLILQGILNLK